MRAGDIKTHLATLSKIKSDFAAISVSTTSVWEQVQHRIITTQIHEMEAMFEDMLIMATGLTANGIVIPNFHFSGALAVARSFLEHHLVTVTIDAAKTEKLINDASKRSELMKILQEMIEVSNNAKHEISSIFSDALRATRSFETPTTLSIAQRMHAITTIKIYGEIAAAAQDKLNKL